MKKRILSALLVFCLLLTAMVIPTSAVDTGAEEGKSVDYDALYVGADGSATTNGGYLTVLLTAFGDSTAIKDDGKWYNKMDNSVYATLTSNWSGSKNGGLSYHVAGLGSATNEIVLPISALPSGNYTVEMVGAVTGATQDADGKTDITAGPYGSMYENSASFCLGPLQQWVFSGKNDYDADDAYTGNKLMSTYCGGSDNWNTATAANDWKHVLTYTTGGDGIIEGYRAGSCPEPDRSVMTYGVTLSITGTEAKTSHYTYYRNATALVLHTKNATNWDAKVSEHAYTTIEKNDTQSFKVFSHTGAVAYAVRVYDAPLTVDEMLINHYVDLAAYVGADITAFGTLTADLQLTVAKACKTLTFATATQTAILDALKAPAALQASKQMTKYDALYVGADGSATTNGGHLTTLLSAFADSTAIKDNGKWYNKMDSSVYATLTNHWNGSENGGLSYHVAGLGSATNEIVIPISALPSGNYTVEMVGAVTGATQDADGKTDITADKYGSMYENSASFCLGPLQQWVFSGKNDYDDDDAYTGNKLMSTYGDGTNTWSTAGGWQHVLPYTTGGGGHAQGTCAEPDRSVLTYAVSLSITGTESKTSHYVFYKNATVIDAWLHNATGWKPNAKEHTYTTIEKNDTQSFKVFSHTGAVAYAVRVYDAPLTADEMLINHFADLAAYVNLDVTSYAKLSAKAKLLVAKECATVSFEDVTTTTLAAAVAKGIASEAIKYVGLSARLNGTTAYPTNAGIRSLYALDTAAITEIEKYYNVTYGAMVGITTLKNTTTGITKASDLTVTGSFNAGFNAEKAASQAITIYQTGAAIESKYLSDVYGDGTNIPGFAFTTILGDDNEAKEYYEMGLVYASFLVLTDKITGAVVETVYIPASGQTFAQNGAPTSIYEVANYFATNEGLAENPILKKVLDACQ